MLSVIKKSTMVLSKRLRDVISDKRKHHGFIGEVTGWGNVISDKRKQRGFIEEVEGCYQ